MAKGAVKTEKDSRNLTRGLVGCDAVAEKCIGRGTPKSFEQDDRFYDTPYEQRIVLIPQCLRVTARCKAVELGAEYVCRACGSCKIGEIIKRAADLGYMGVRILKGGSVLRKTVARCKARAVVGIACPPEGTVGMAACRRLGLSVRFVPLLRDGCADTDVDLARLFEIMERRSR